MSWPRGSRSQKTLTALFFLSVRSTPKCDFGAAEQWRWLMRETPLGLIYFRGTEKQHRAAILAGSHLSLVTLK